MSENAAPKLSTRLGLLALAILLPLLAAAALVSFAAGAVMVGSTDRALVWAEGSRSQIETMRQRVADSPWFTHGRTRAPDAGNPLPAGCGETAHEFSLGGLRAEQAQAARSVLESYAHDVGATVCLSNVFIINEHPDPVATPPLARISSALLQSALIPCGVALLIYWAFAGQLRLQPNAGGKPLPVQLGTAVIAAFVGVLALVGLGWLLRAAGWTSHEPTVGSLADLGPYLLVAIMFSEPLLEELSFRAWLIPLAERTIGTAGAGTLSTVLFASMHLPFGWDEFASALIAGAVLTATYLRTRSLLACVVANALMAGASLLIAW